MKIISRISVVAYFFLGVFSFSNANAEDSSISSCELMDEVGAIHKEFKANTTKGMSVEEATKIREEKLLKLSQQYERELMNPKEALALGSVSSIIIPGFTRRVLAKNLNYLMKRYQPSAMGGIQREFE